MEQIIDPALNSKKHISEINSIVENLNNKILDLETKYANTIKAKDAIISEKEDIIRAKDNSIYQRDSLIKTKESLILQKESIIREKDYSIYNKDSIIKEKENTINKEFSEKIQLISRLLNCYKTLESNNNSISRSEMREIKNLIKVEVNGNRYSAYNGLVEIMTYRSQSITNS